MTLCPIAMAVGCPKCPVFKICPLKNQIGNMPTVKSEVPAVPQRKPKAGAKTTTRARRGRK